MNIATNILENFGCSCEIGTQTTIKSNTIKDLFYTKLCLAQKLKRLQIRYNRLKEQVRVRVEKDKNNSEWKCMQTIKTDAANMNPRAIFIWDQIKNYSKMVRINHSPLHCVEIFFPKRIRVSQKSAFETTLQINIK
jgi:hypothetical protein